MCPWRLVIRWLNVVQADADTDMFLNEKHSFDDLVREVRRYRRLANDIAYKSVKVGRIFCTALLSSD